MVMYKDLLTQSPLLILPMAAMFVFLAVFVAITVREVVRSSSEVDAAARLPLHREGKGRHDHR
jgi:hypothetical protein